MLAKVAAGGAPAHGSMLPALIKQAKKFPRGQRTISTLTWDRGKETYRIIALCSCTESQDVGRMIFFGDSLRAPIGKCGLEIEKRQWPAETVSSREGQLRFSGALAEAACRNK